MSKIVAKISKSNAVELIKNSKGRFFTVKFEKNDGTTRVLNGNVKGDNVLDNQGYIKFKSSKEGMKSINPRTIKSITIDKVKYKVK